MIERKFHIDFVSDLALREKQIQQNYRPIIAVHKWFARRPGTLFRSLLLSEFADGPLEQEFFSPQDFKGKTIADPFMGGGTPLIEANRIGCNSIGFDINPLAWWIVREQIEHLDLAKYRSEANRLRQSLEKEVGSLYQTRCIVDGRKDAPVKYFLWVKVLECDACKCAIDLFPGYLLAENVRHPQNVVVCANCGDLNEVKDLTRPGGCKHCGVRLVLKGPVLRGICTCPKCGAQQKIQGKRTVPFEHRMFAIEYANPECSAKHTGRFFKKPDADDLEKVDIARDKINTMRARFVPIDLIPNGDETARLHRWGYKRYREMFNDRQLLGLELSCRTIANVVDERVHKALATNLSDLLRYQNMLCRYDTMALKSLDIFSVHGFPVGLVQVESNLLGVVNPSSGMPIGSGGWHNIIEKYAKAKEYCALPFEIHNRGKRKTVVPMTGEWIGESRGEGKQYESRLVTLECKDSATHEFPPKSLDAVFTDPPYFGNVQYSELMDFCYVWLRGLLKDCPTFSSASTRRPDELTGNITEGRGLVHFTDGMSRVFKNIAGGLKDGAPLAFTFHHNDIKAYHPLAVAILDANLVCSASLPCPAEMGASIHISGTKSSIVDSVLVCRSTGIVPRKWLPENPEALVELISNEIDQLELGGVKPTEGDVRCTIYGHLTRLAIWDLRHTWHNLRSVSEKLNAVNAWWNNYCDIEDLVGALCHKKKLAARQFGYAVAEKHETYDNKADEISF